MGAVVKYFLKDKPNDVKRAELRANAVKEAFEAMMEGAAMMIDIVGPIEYTYPTKSGNKIRARLDSPE